MRFGAFLFTSQFDGLSESQVLDAALRYAEQAEDAGFDDLWVDEHHFIPYGVNPSATTFAAFLLGRTRHLRVGTAVVLLPQLAPVFVAEQAALLDHLSGGRFDLGIGRGGPSIDLAVAGRTFEHWSQGYWPAVDQLLDAWGGEVADAPGITVKPAPRTAPRPPVFTASVSDASVDEAARRGIPLLLFLHETDETRAAKVVRWAALAAEHGHDTAHPGHAFAVVGHVIAPGDSTTEIADNLYDFFLRSSDDYVWLPEATQLGPDTAHSPEQLRSYVDQIVATHPIGTAAECIDRLGRSLRVSGIDRVLIMLEAAAEPDRVARNIAAFGTDVPPAIRAMSIGPRLACRLDISGCAYKHVASTGFEEKPP